MKKVTLFIMLVAIVSFQIFSIGFSYSNNNEKYKDSTLYESAKKATHRAFGTQFFENFGQIDDERVIFYCKIPGGLIGFGKSIVISWLEGSQDPVIITFKGAASVFPKGINQLGHPTNYLLGDRGTYRGVRCYENLVYEGLWDGIDLIYKMNDAGCKYEFLVNPGARVEDIAIQYSDFDSLEFDSDSMTVRTGARELKDEGLKVYQDDVVIPSCFQPIAMDTFGFLVGPYDKALPLTIDPLVYSTYIGGNHNDEGLSIDVDSNGYVYVTGETHSTDMPRINAYDDTLNADSDDCFVLKLNQTSGDLIYATYVVGSLYDGGQSIVVDGLGYVYVAGNTNSGNFPVVNEYDTQTAGYDCFVFKLDSDGDELLYSTYVGGSANDFAYSITIDSYGNAYVTGHTNSVDFPIVNELYGSLVGAKPSAW